MLEVIVLLINQGKPRVQNYYEDIIKSLLKLVIDITMLPVDSESANDIILHITGIFKLMKDGCPFICQSLDMIIDRMPVQGEKGRALVGYMRLIKNSL